ncbi:MAG: hypothetical protein Q8R18_02040 [bacterium]|nr:hypothetical protein [bacterium]
MEELENFLTKLYNEFKESEALLHGILKEEKKLEEDILTKKGFIIRSYSLNYSKIDLSQLDKLLSELERILSFEVVLQEQLNEHVVSLNKIEAEYSKITKKRLHSDLLQKELKDVLDYFNLMITRIKQLKKMLEDGLRLHPKALGRDTEIFFASFEQIANKILRFVHFLEQFTRNILLFEREAYYPEPRTYGRAMSSHEFKETISSKCLSSGKDPTPVFDAPAFVINRINSMPKDEIKNFFAQIGVEVAIHIVFFRTKIKPVNFDRPIPQSNGLREYKFPKGIDIELLEAA